MLNLGTRTYRPNQSRSGKWVTVVSMLNGNARYSEKVVLDGTLDAVIGSLEALRASIPEEFRASATCEIDSEGDYDGGHYVTVQIEYERPATAEEIALVESRSRDEAAAKAAQERAVYEALKAKFG